LTDTRQPKGSVWGIFEPVPDGRAARAIRRTGPVDMSLLQFKVKVERSTDYRSPDQTACGFRGQRTLCSEAIKNAGLSEALNCKLKPSE
jgi:hypothetical protein